MEKIEENPGKRSDEGAAKMGFEKSLNIKMGLSTTWGDVDWGHARWRMKAHILGKYSHRYQESL